MGGPAAFNAGTGRIRFLSANPEAPLYGPRKRRSTRAALSLLLPAALLLSALPSPAAAGGPAARLRVKAGPFERRDTPLWIALDRIPVHLDADLNLVEVRGGERVPVPCQVEPGRVSRLYWILSGKTPAGGERVFELSTGAAPPFPATVTFRDDGRGLLVSVRGRPVLRYHHAACPPPEGASARYARSGFIHPLFSPSGAELTRIHPPDHLHHMGLWNPFAKTRFEGREVDFWNLGKGRGTVRFDGFEGRTVGPVFGGFRARHVHVDLSAPGGGKAALREVWDLRVYDIGPPEKAGFLLDFTSLLRCASSSPVLLERYRYGGLGFRAAASWNEGDYLTSEGKTRKDGHGTRARWCMVYGPTDKGPAGIVFMDHPNNREHPEPLRIWNQRPEIFFNFCPVQKAEWTIEPGRTYVLKYRLYVYDGSASPGEAERLWRDFAHPPEVSVEVEPD